MLNPYVILSAIGILLGASGYSYWAGYSNASDKCDAEKWKSQVESLQKDLERQKIASASAAAERDRIEKESQELEAKVSEYEKALSPTGKCIDPDAARGLRKL